MEARVKIEFENARSAENALRALKQETEFKKRSESKIARERNNLIINIRAEDIVALRATLNSYLRLIQVIKEIEKR